MPIIVNGIPIPTDGDYIVINDVKIDKVNVVKNGLTTTVWEKLKELIILDDNLTDTLTPPTITITTTGSGSDLQNNYTLEEGYWWSSYWGAYAPWYNDDGSAGGTYFTETWDNHEENFVDSNGKQFHAIPCYSLLESIRSFDVTNYKYCTVTVTGGIPVQPSGSQSNYLYLYIGFDLDHKTQLGVRHTWDDSSGNIGSGDQVSGIIYNTSDWVSANTANVWATTTIDISGLTGTQTLKLITDHSYVSSGWCRIKYIKLHN